MSQCAPCEAARKRRTEEAQRAIQQVKRPVNQLNQQSNDKPASPNFTSPKVLPPLKSK